MALEQDKVQYLDDWKDLKDYTKKKHEAAEKEKDQHNVTKHFVGEQIDDYKTYDEAKEQAEYDKIYQKIDDISVGGGVDLSPYLKIEDASANFATKADIPSVEGYATKSEVNAALENKADKAEIPVVPTIVSAFENDAHYLTEHQDISNLASKDELEAIEAQIPDVSAALEPYALKTELPDTTGLASKAEVNAALDELNIAIGQKADTVDVSAAVENIETVLDEKADSTDVPSKEEFEALKGQFEELKQLVYEYAPGSEQEAIQDGEIADLSPDNKSVHVDEPMKSVVLPESTGTLYTVEVPLRDESSVELTSPKAATITNTSDEPVNTTFTAPEPTGSSNTKIYLSGLFEDIELTNVNLDKSSSYDAAIISGNVTITEANTKPVTVAAEFSNGCVVKNESDCDVTLNNKSAVGSSVTVLAPGSTVTIQGGQWEELETTVGDDTLYINSAAHIKKLVVNKGNVIVNSYDVSNCVDEIINETEYTVSPRVIEVTSKTEWNKASSTDALYEVQNDISTNIRIAPGIFGSQAKMNLNNFEVNCSDANGAFVLRGNSHYIIENGTINATGYGIWLAGPGTVELNNVHIIADSHALYIEKTGGQIITTGNCRFEVSNDDKRYVANYLDSTYTGGWTHGYHFGENSEFVDFDPAASIGEPGGPVNLLDEGYHTESYTEGEHTIYKVVKDSE